MFTRKYQEVIAVMLQQRKLQLHDKEGCFTSRCVKHCRGLPREWGITHCLQGFSELVWGRPQKLSLILKITQVSEQELGQKSNSNIGFSVSL